MKTATDNTPILSLDIVRAIIVREMELDESRVGIYNQKYKIPQDDGLFVVVGYKGTRNVTANRNSQIITGGVYTEVQEITAMESIFVSIMSRSIEALQRKEELLMAVNSIYSQQVQEANGMRISRMSPIEDLSDLEGSAMLYRFEIFLSCFTWYRKTKTADYFNSFTTELSTEQQSAMPITLGDPQRLLTEDGHVLLDENGYPISTEEGE